MSLDLDWTRSAQSRFPLDRAARDEREEMKPTSVRLANPLLLFTTTIIHNGSRRQPPL